MRFNFYIFSINGPGVHRIPDYPKAFENFKGQIVHAAEWDTSINLEKKVVGIIGSGASAIQIIPEIAPFVEELHCYQRTPAWILPRAQGKIPNGIKRLFKWLPPIMHLLRILIFCAFEVFHLTFKHNSWLNKYCN